LVNLGSSSLPQVTYLCHPGSISNSVELDLPKEAALVDCLFASRLAPVHAPRLELVTLNRLATGLATEPLDCLELGAC